MRISEQEKTAIIKSAKNVFGKNIKVYLFGSRVDNNKKGGDIDIYIKLPEPINSTDKLSKKISLNTVLINLLGDQKFDIIVNDNTDDKLIYKVAEQEGVRLC